MELNKSKIHFVGIGGIGMSGIAEVLVNMGCAVSGSDQSVNAQVERLKHMGVDTFQGHAAGNLPKLCHAVVYSSAVNAKNPEIIEARRRKIPVIQRAEMLAELMSLKRGIAIGGTHGKTTTTSMVATMMIHAKLDPTIVIGGRLDLIKSSASLGQGEWLLAEADESDGSFLRLSPELAVVTNIDHDHMDHYSSFDNLKKSFEQFVSHVPFYGCAILCSEDLQVRKLAKHSTKRTLLYGFGKDAQLRAENLTSRNGQQTFDVSLDLRHLGQVTLNVPGRHNVLNSLAALGVGLELGLGFEIAAEGIRHYSGVDRRMQKIGEITHVEIYDDYGHHPTEVRATLSALRELFPDRRLVVAFQPHRYSRNKACWKDFQSCFKGADVLGLLDVYAAGEKKLPSFTSEKMSRAVAKKTGKKNVKYWGSHKKALAILKAELKPEDVFLTLGAGDVYKLGRELLAGK